MKDDLYMVSKTNGEITVHFNKDFVNLKNCFHTPSPNLVTVTQD